MADLNDINPDLERIHPSGLRWSFRDEAGRMPESPHGPGVGWTRDREEARRLAPAGATLVGLDEEGYEVTSEELD